MAKQTVTVKKTTTKVSVKQSNSSSSQSSKRCPTCGKFMSSK